MRIPFTYLIGWTKHKKFYYGVRYGKDAHPTTLWNTYFTSSKDVAEFRLQNGEPDIIQVRRTFKNTDKAKEWEVKVLQRMHVARSETWLNRREAPAFPCFEGAANPLFKKQHTFDARLKISKANTGKQRTLEQRKAISIRQIGKTNPFFNKNHTKESKLKIASSVSKATTGANNPSAKSYKFINPNNIHFHVTGEFSKFCVEHDLSRSKMYRSIDQGQITPFSGGTQQTQNCVGWEVIFQPQATC
ncbi:NUMOD3 domain-containing DNA-binding protein [Acinetobacter sp.]|uniref:NUMOD3 domain-containing DNA-binding protein n=1 Tax=Acinetobacter sp. TaxID=472 RepID=UPI00388F49BF